MNVYVKDPVPCPICSNFISADSNVCSYCGHIFKAGEIKKYRNIRTLKIIGAASVITFIFNSLFGKFVCKK